MRTWHVEMAVVAAVLGAVLWLTEAPARELLGAAAVLAGFGHASVSDRMAAAQARQSAPDVACFRWAQRYWVVKELCWVGYFAASRSYSALVGCAVFLLYPLWRALWRRL
jgi:hypothetical protein